MDERIIRSLQGRTTPEEEEHLRAWRAAEPENEARYRTVRELWSLARTAAPEPEEELPDVDAIIVRAEAEREAEMASAAGADRPDGAPDGAPPVQSGGASARWGRRAAVGALAAGLVAVGFGLGAAVDGGEERSTLLSKTDIATGAGEMTTLTLGDGSSIRLGPRSRMRLMEKGGRRMAWLKGRAFFGVRADSARPFTVRTEYGEAEVLGTRFEVRSEDEEFRVLVVEGEVSVAAGDEEGSVREGEMSRADRGRGLSTERVRDVYQHLGWIGNAIVFQATPLDRALREIERRHGMEITLEDPALADVTVTATFTDRSVEQVVFVLCEIVDTTCALTDERIRVGATDAKESPPSVEAS